MQHEYTNISRLMITNLLDIKIAQRTNLVSKTSTFLTTVDINKEKMTVIMLLCYSPVHFKGKATSVNYLSVLSTNKSPNDAIVFIGNVPNTQYKAPTINSSPNHPTNKHSLPFEYKQMKWSQNALLLVLLAQQIQFFLCECMNASVADTNQYKC